MPTTASSSLPYPAASASPNVPADIQALATSLDQRVIIQAASQSARTNLTSKYDGMRVYEQSSQRLFRWNAGASRWDFVDGPGYTWTPVLQDGSGNAVTGATSTTGSYTIREGRLRFQASFKFTDPINGQLGALNLKMPSGCISRTTEPEQHSIVANLTTPFIGRDWVGVGFAFVNDTRVGLLFPISYQDCSMALFANATSAGATGTGTPVIAGGYPLMNNARLTVHGEYELSSWPAL